MSLFGQKPRIMPTFEKDATLVLKTPKHYHASGFAYDALARDGRTFMWSTAWDNLTGNDLMVIAESARQRAHRRFVHVSGWRICLEKHPD